MVIGESTAAAAGKMASAGACGILVAAGSRRAAKRETLLENAESCSLAGAMPDLLKRILLGACFSINIMNGVYLGAIGVLLPRIGKAFGIDSGGLGRIIAAGFAGSIVSVLICGFLSDKLGRRCVVSCAAAFFGLGLLLVGAAGGEAAILCASPLIGAGCAGMQAVATALTADLYPQRRAFVLNWCQVAFAIGAVVGPAGVYALLTSGSSWRAVYAGLGVVALGLAVLTASQPIPGPAASASGLRAAGVFKVLWQPSFILLCSAQLLYAGAEVGFFAWLPTYFEKSLAGGAAWVGSVVSVFWLAMAVGRTCMSFVLGRYATLKIGATLAVAGAAGAFLALSFNRPALVLLFVAHTGLCYGGIYSAILVEAGDRFHAGLVLGSALGVISAASSAGTAIVPWAVGALAVHLGAWRPALALAPTSAVMAAVLLGALSFTKNVRASI